MFNPLPVRAGSVAPRVRVLAARVLAHQPPHAQQAVRRRQQLRHQRRPQHRRRVLRPQRARQLHRHGPALGRPGGAPSCRRCSTASGTASIAYPIQSLAAGAARTPRDAFDAPGRSQPAPPAAAVVARRARPERSSAAAGRRPRRAAACAAPSVIADAPQQGRRRTARRSPTVAVRRTLALLASARSEVLVASPYFVPGAEHAARSWPASDARDVARLGADQLPGHHRRAAGALRLCALSPGAC